jgi:branched-chain amino acid transport system ATP-binding protein
LENERSRDQELGQALLDVRQLVVAYGHVVAINRMSFSVKRGECMGVVGANGAGKSTLFRTIAGMLKPRGGTIMLDGRDIAGMRPWQVAKSRLRLVPEGRELFGGLSVEENLLVGGGSSDNVERDKVLEHAFELFPALEGLRTRKARVLSGGEQQMLAIARAMVARPSILLLDEPSLGLSPAIVSMLISTLRAIRESGVTVLVAEQSLKIPRELCTRVVVCSNGRAVAEGSPNEVLTDSMLRQAFLAG